MIVEKFKVISELRTLWQHTDIIDEINFMNKRLSQQISGQEMEKILFIPEKYLGIKSPNGYTVLERINQFFPSIRIAASTQLIQMYLEARSDSP